MSRSIHQTRSARPVGGQSCCAVVLHTPPSNCGIDCIKGHRHAPDYNVGHFIKQLQIQFFDVHKRQYPIVMFHTDLTMPQKRIMRTKTLSPILFHKINLNPMALPTYLRPMFASIVNATKAAHANGDLFRPEHSRATFRGFQQRMLSRFHVGEMLLDHKALRGYKYILKFDAIESRITSAFSYNPFERAHATKTVYSYYSTFIEPAPTIVNPVLRTMLDQFPFSEKLLRPFITKFKGDIIFNGRAYSQAAELFKLESFRSSVYRSIFTSLESSILLSEIPERSLTNGQFLGLAMPFVSHASSSSSSPAPVTELTDLPISHPVDVDETYI